ncbi:hypothetical protein F5Y07DRAFT_383238 [Xylaria sp. FL0933]|nr:hypothetical protein F5Y07DRAFT_383238 [Xylaria sp. FL0933]
MWLFIAILSGIVVGSHRLTVDTPMKAMAGGYPRPTIPDPSITITELRPVFFRGISNNFMLASLLATTVITVGIRKDSHNRLSRTKGTHNITMPYSALGTDLHLLIMPKEVDASAVNWNILPHGEISSDGMCLMHAKMVLASDVCRHAGAGRNFETR